jgi:hypothetical protein
VLKESPATAKAKAKFILATDSMDFEAFVKLPRLYLP